MRKPSRTGQVTTEDHPQSAPDIALIINAIAEHGRCPEPDSVYFARRAFQERQAAFSATHPDAKEAHFELAARYQDMAEQIELHSHKLDRVSRLFQRARARRSLRA